MSQETPKPLPSPDDDETFALELLDQIFDPAKTPEEAIAFLDALAPQAREALSRRELRAHIKGAGLVGHEHGEDFELAAAQVSALAKGIHGVATPVALAATKIVRNLSDFLAGQCEPLYLRISAYGFEAEITPKLLQELLVGQDVQLREVSPSELMHSSLFGSVYDALLQLLRDRGLFRGPCPRCGTKEWPVKPRPAGARGRPPLEYDYCPACLVERERARRAGNQRRYREKVKDSGPPAHQDPTVDAAIYGGPSTPVIKPRPAPRKKTKRST